MAKRTFTKEETAAVVVERAKQKKLVSAELLCYDPTTLKVLIVMANYKDWWSLPGGICDAGESPQNTAVRETFEEIGIAVKPETVKFVGVERAAYDLEQTDRLYFVFAAQISQNTALTLQSDEIDEAKWVSSDELRKISGNRGSLKIVADWIENGTIQYADFGL